MVKIPCLQCSCVGREFASQCFSDRLLFFICYSLCLDFASAKISSMPSTLHIFLWLLWHTVHRKNHTPLSYILNHQFLSVSSSQLLLIILKSFINLLDQPPPPKKKNNNQTNKQKCTTKQKPHKSWNYWVAEFFKYSETWLLHHNSGQFSKQRNAWQFFCQHPSLNTREQRYHLYHVYLSDDIVSLFLLMKDSDLRQEFRNGGEVLKRGIWLSHP